MSDTHAWWIISTKNQKQLGTNLFIHLSCDTILYRGVREKGSGDVVSAVCYTIFAIYLLLCTQTDETSSPETFL